MQKLFFFALAVGLIVSGFGMYCMTYMEHTLSSRRRHMAPSGGRRAPVWPLYVAFICIPLGIIIMAGAIVWKNHLPK